MKKSYLEGELTHTHTHTSIETSVLSENVADTESETGESEMITVTIVTMKSFSF